MAVLVAIGDHLPAIGTSVAFGPRENGIAERNAGYMSPAVVLSTTPSLLVRHRAEALATLPPSATATPEPVAAAAPVAADPAPQPAFFTYTIQPGDTASSIAQKFGIDEQYILWNNPHVSEHPDLLIVGADLVIPSTNGIIYTVTLGDTLSAVASYYKIDAQSIAAFLPNRLPSPDSVIEGMVLVLPGAVPPPVPLPAAVAAVEGTGGGAASGSSNSASAAADPPPSSSTGYIWPFHGAISTYFGENGHRGIDIDGFGHYGAPILAAADGQVILAAYQDWGYGNHVIIQHADGSQTLYAHLSEIWVAQGQYVSQGEAVGALGSTGYSTGPHLHFEIHIGGVPVNPLDYLP